MNDTEGPQGPETTEESEEPAPEPGTAEHTVEVVKATATMIDQLLGMAGFQVWYLMIGKGVDTAEGYDLVMRSKTFLSERVKLGVPSFVAKMRETADALEAEHARRMADEAKEAH